MKILITGASGFVGSHGISQLSEYNLQTTTHQELDLTNEDQVRKFLNDKKFDWIVHCASVGGSRLKEDPNCSVNIEMVKNLLEFRKKAKFITFGSGAEYNLERWNDYGRSKRYIRDICLQSKNCYYLRLFGVFGKNEWDTRFITSCIQRCKNNKPISIHQNRLYDFVHIKDVYNIIRLILENKIKHKELDCCYEDKYDLLQIAEYIKLYCESNNKIIVNDKKNYIRDYIGEYKYPIIKRTLFERIEEFINEYE